MHNQNLWCVKSENEKIPVDTKPSTLINFEAAYFIRFDTTKVNDKKTEPADNDYFYCNCGKWPIKETKFRCKDKENHELNFVAFTPFKLQMLLKQLCAFGEKNILILGETGVGKTTWINCKHINLLN